MASLPPDATSLCYGIGTAPKPDVSAGWHQGRKRTE
jgi:hypothetical protein